MLSVEREVIGFPERAEKLKIRVNGAKDVVTNVGNHRLRDEGRPPSKKGRFERFD